MYFFYRVGNVECFTPWDLPTKSKLKELMLFFNKNFSHAYLFKISLHGAFNSTASRNTWDIDLKIHFVDINKKNYQIIYDCFKFLYYYGLNKFNILVDIKYTDYQQSNTYNFCRLIKKNKTIDKTEYLKIRESQGEVISFTDTYEKKSVSENFLIKTNKHKKVLDVHEAKLFLIDHSLCWESKSYKKFVKNILNNCMYYEDVIINYSCNINYDYFNTN